VATNNYTGGTIVTSNTLYLAGDGALGSGSLLLKTNTTFRLANIWTMQNPITVTVTGETFQVDDGGYVTITNPVVPDVATTGGPLKKTSNGIVEFDATNTFGTGPVTINSVTQNISYIVSGGALMFGGPATIATAPPNGSIQLLSGAIGWRQPPPGGNIASLTALVYDYTDSQGGIAVVRGQESLPFDFRSPVILNMALTAAQTMTFTGTYIPWYLGDGQVGPAYELAAIVGRTLSGPNRLPIAMADRDWCSVGMGARSQDRSISSATTVTT